jgi:p-aminobenzoyl-glutamate transporter AbgT
VLVCQIVVTKVKHLNAGVTHHVHQQHLHVVSLIQVAGLTNKLFQNFGLANSFAHLLPAGPVHPEVHQVKALK